jgi:uncharacterized protein (DUF1800 family)
MVGVLFTGQISAVWAAPFSEGGHGFAGAGDASGRELHLLNRFTFGPTAEDIAAIHALGVEGWFELQLHPDRIALTARDGVLAARLAELPALQLPVGQILERFPSGAEIRQIADGKRPMPDDATLDLIYQRHIDIYKDKRDNDKREADKLANKAAGAPGMMEHNMLAAPVLPKVAAPVAHNPADDLFVKAVLALSPADRVRRILEMPEGDYERLRGNLIGPQKMQLTADMTAEQRELVSDFENPSRVVVEELQGERLLRDIYSSRQLQEVMTTFWLNHFNVYLHKNDETPYYLVSYERDVIRPRALGNFEDLLVAAAESPAMLMYLDNSSSTGPDSIVAEKQKQRAAAGKAGKETPPGLNENYARELMELHTLGVNGGYTQKDVTEVAKVFTGWTVDHPQQGGGFKFDESRHEPGAKFVLGHKIDEAGQNEGLQLLHVLANSPATARFVSQELAVAFVGDAPARSLINRMSQSYLRTHGDIASVLRTMVHSPEFWASESYQAKVKTPLEFVVSAVRMTGADVTNAEPLVNALNQMGMPLYGCVPPTGYANAADAWVSTGALVTRMNFGLSLASGHYAGVTWAGSPSVSNAGVAKAQPNSPPMQEGELEHRLIPSGLSNKTRDAVMAQLQGQAKSPNGIGMAASLPVAVASRPLPTVPKANMNAGGAAQNALLAGLLLGSPEFQRR